MIEPDKPVEQMTREEKRSYMTQLILAMTEDQLEEARLEFVRLGLFEDD
ncbi:MAG: hypothetical protein AB3N15_05940 [Paracoccaceae bacterium]